MTEKMEIQIQDLGKRFGREWIFKNLNATIKQGEAWAIVGSNGSGKTTLLKIISAYLAPTKGKVIYKKNKAVIDDSNIFQYLSWVSPYSELIEEFTLWEMLNFHDKFKPFNTEKEQILDSLAFFRAKNKRISLFSSGMKQKLKLALAFYSASEVMLFDEPTSNLDKKNIDWYNEQISSCSEKRIIFVCSNQEYEYGFCNQKISILDFKQ